MYGHFKNNSEIYLMRYDKHSKTRRQHESRTAACAYSTSCSPSSCAAKIRACSVCKTLVLWPTLQNVANLNESDWEADSSRTLEKPFSSSNVINASQILCTSCCRFLQSLLSPHAAWLFSTAWTDRERLQWDRLWMQLQHLKRNGFGHSIENMPCRPWGGPACPSNRCLATQFGQHVDSTKQPAAEHLTEHLTTGTWQLASDKWQPLHWDKASKLTQLSAGAATSTRTLPQPIDTSWNAHA